MDLAHPVAVAVDIEAGLLEHYPALARRLTLVLRDAAEAEDTAQAAFARALEQRHRFAGGDLRAWFYTIALRLAFNELRRRRSRDGRTTDDRSPEREPTWAMSTDPDLWAALAGLEPEHRAALLLSTLEGYTHAEIGAILGVRAGTVSSWLSRTKDRLRKILGDDDR